MSPPLVALRITSNGPTARERFSGVRRILIIVAAFAIANGRLNFWLVPIFAQDSKPELETNKGTGADAALERIEKEIAANRLEDSESQLQSYVHDQPGSARAHYDLGYVQFRTHNIKSSIVELSKSLELSSENAEAHKVLGLDCSIVGRYDLAEIELQEAARLKPDSGEIRYFLARAYYTLGVYPLAKSEFETAIRLDPGSVKAYSNLGIAEEALGDNDGALKNYTRAVQLQEQDTKAPKSEWPYIYLSAFYNRQRNATEALVYAQKALHINPRADNAYFEMAKSYRTRNELLKSAAASRDAIAISPQAQYYYVLAQVLRESGDWKESAVALAKYAELQRQVEASQSARSREEPVIAVEP